ncbi:hypothetical protein [Meridianimarinicoccus zhengii]|uniref:hypothetical protein n=1 Tax=Meridianimarinicoccus zhengii TaxID=2056810 RepID=UPI000DAD0361|nr:hypothetical protein [Phycocomes zhengii]
MEFIADLLLIAAALGAAFYCFILSRRLSTLNSAEGGIGKAIATLSEQVERLERTLEGSRERAEDVDKRLRSAIEEAGRAEAAIVAALAASPPVRTAPKTQGPRPEPQPASFRRRLFSDAAAERET